MNFHQSTETGKPVFEPLVDSFELLMKLYPDEHPANLHGVMCVTNNNVVDAMNILQYYRHYREMYKRELERSTSTYLPPSTMSTYVPQESTIMPTSPFKTQHTTSANEVQFPSSMNTDQLSASMYAYKTLPTMFANQAQCQTFTSTDQLPACMYTYKTQPTVSAHEAQIPASTNAGQLPAFMYEPERFMYKYEPELSRSLYQPSIPTSQQQYSLFDQQFSMSLEEKQFYNSTCVPQSSILPHDPHICTPQAEPQFSCTSQSEPQSTLPVFDPQPSVSSKEAQHSSSVSEAGEAQTIINIFDTPTTSTDLSTTSAVESESVEQDYEVSNNSSDDENREYVVLVPVDNQEMELTPSGLVPPAYRMASVYRGRNGQFMKNLD